MEDAGVQDEEMGQSKGKHGGCGSGSVKVNMVEQ